jgi:hypothetical protein
VVSPVLEEVASTTQVITEDKEKGLGAGWSHVHSREIVCSTVGALASIAKFKQR